MHKNSCRSLALAVLVAGALPLISGGALAADCPAGKTGTDVMKPGPTTPSGMTETVIATINLTPLGSGFDGRKMRTRTITLQPGGHVPWHDHANRPTTVYLKSGSVTEYRSTCAVPIEHRPGDVTSEFGPASHWWKNNGKAKVVFIVVDMI